MGPIGRRSTRQVMAEIRMSRWKSHLGAALWAVLFVGLLLGRPALSKDDFLPPQKAYRYATRVEGDRLIVTWTIEPGYYLYKKRMGVVSTMDSVQLGEPAWPRGEDHE